jgi:fructuronate reductase
VFKVVALNRASLGETDFWQKAGVDLYQVGAGADLGRKIEGYFKEMIAGPGAVKQTLGKYLGVSA